MDIFKNPWKTSIINNDPILELSNSKREEKKDNLIDRYCYESLSKNLFYIEKDKKEESEEISNKINNNQSKDKNYLNLLIKTTCNTNYSKKINNHISSSSSILKNSSILSYKSKINKSSSLSSFSSSSLTSSLSNSYSSNYSETFSELFTTEEELNHHTNPRNIPKEPYRILNAPKLKDDFYTNLLDWNEEDLISVVLDNATYIWNSKENETEKLIEGFISCIKWKNNKNIIIGEETGKLKIIDIYKKKELFKIRAHNGRIGTIDSIYNSNIILSGSKDCNILLYDIRSRSSIFKYESHKQEVCGVKLSQDGNMIASGGNDNIVSIFDIRAGKNLYKFYEHTAAIKALAWSPHQGNILATGGGSTDKSIRIWNILEGKCIKKIDTGSQVCNMIYSINSNELVSTHGFSMNAINIWNAKNMEKIGTLRGHSYRVLYLARSPDGESILTGSGDQTLRFWKIFPNLNNMYSRVSDLEARNTFVR